MRRRRRLAAAATCCRPTAPRIPPCKQDIITSLLLSEAIYKAAEGSPAAALDALGRLRAAFPPGLAPLQAVQFSRRAAEHRCVWGQMAPRI